MENNTKKRCSICQMEYEEYGCNARPVNDGRCCNVCDNEIVTPARLRLLGMNVPREFGPQFRVMLEEAKTKMEEARMKEFLESKE